MFNMFYEMHRGSWLLLIIAFVISYFFMRQKVSPIIMRLFMLIMLFSGIGMLWIVNFPLVYIIKGILAIILIASMEMILGRRRRNESTGMQWGLFAISLLLVILLGYGVISF